MKHVLRWYDYITFNIYFLGLSTLSQTLSGFVFPLLVQQFVGDTDKGTYLGTLRLWTLMVALLAQAFWGILSDRNTSRWGRRRPYILGGSLIDLIFIGGIAFSATLSGWTGYLVLFVMVVFLQISSNAAQAAQQGIIPDLVPEDKRGRFSAIKAVFEVPLPVIVVAGTVYIAGRIQGGSMTNSILLLFAAGMVLVCALLTLFAREKPLEEKLPPLDWAPVARLLLMTALFTVIILGLGEGIKLFARLLQSIGDITLLLVILGAAGLLAMGAAIVLGVWVSVRISVGAAARQNPSFTWWVVNRLAFLASVANIASFILYYLQGRLGLHGEEAAGPAANLQVAIGILILVSALASGWLSDRFGHKRVVAAAGLIAALGTVIAIAVPNLNVIFVGGALIGAGAGMFYTANWALGTSIVPQGQAGRYLGISNLAGAGAGAVGSYIGGPIADYITARVPESPGLGYVLLFVIFAVLFLASVLALTRVHEPSAQAVP
ncbi:MAG: MFS transporter [Anaerolineae bacterium]